MTVCPKPQSPKPQKMSLSYSVDGHLRAQDRRYLETDFAPELSMTLSLPRGRSVWRRALVSPVPNLQPAERLALGGGEELADWGSLLEHPRPALCRSPPFSGGLQPVFFNRLSLPHSCAPLRPTLGSAQCDHPQPWAGVSQPQLTMTITMWGSWWAVPQGGGGSL